MIINENNLGFAKANNSGAKSAKGDVLFFLNSDTLLTQDILPAIEKCFNQEKSLGALSPKLMSSENIQFNDAYGKFPSLSSLVSTNLSGKKYFQLDENIELSEVDWISGAALVMRSDVFEKIGGWDGNFFLYFEDTDLCWRIKDAGYKIAVINSISLIHLCGKSISSDKIRRRHYFKAQDYFFKKHYGIFISILMRMIRCPYKLKVLYIN